ncbi:RpfH protein, partial [Xanthomonas perforans]|nr:RpfH protein [Xanthomonas perforans]
MRAALAQLRRRLARRPDSEHGQAVVRIVMLWLILAYTLVCAPHWQLSDDHLQRLLCLVAIGHGGALLLFAWIVAK